MPGTTSPRYVGRIAGHPIPESGSAPMKAGAVIANGTLVFLLAGFATNTPSAGAKCVGVASIPRTLDNSTGANGDLTVTYDQGVLGPFVNSANADEITSANLEQDCYAADNQTVTLTSGDNARPYVGKIKGIDDDGNVQVQVVSVGHDEAALVALRKGQEGAALLARFATTGNLNLSTTGLTAIDGVTPVAGNIALVKDQTTASQNGLYVVGATAWTRLLDTSGGSLLREGLLVSVAEGTVSAGAIYALGSDLTTYGVATVSKYAALALADPGTGAAIPVVRSATVNMTIAAGIAETNTLAIPTFIGQLLVLNVDTLGAAGTRAITAAQAINVAGNTVMTFNAARDYATLRAITVGGALRWQIEENASVSLS